MKSIIIFIFLFDTFLILFSLQYIIKNLILFALGFNISLNLLAVLLKYSELFIISFDKSELIIFLNKFILNHNKFILIFFENNNNK